MMDQYQPRLAAMQESQGGRPEHVTAKKRGSTQKEWSLMKVVAGAREEDTPLPGEHLIQGGGRIGYSVSRNKNRGRRNGACLSDKTNMSLVWFHHNPAFLYDSHARNAGLNSRAASDSKDENGLAPGASEAVQAQKSRDSALIHAIAGQGKENPPDAGYDMGSAVAACKLRLLASAMQHLHDDSSVCRVADDGMGISVTSSPGG